MYNAKVTEVDQPLIITSVKKKVLGKGGIMEEIAESIFVLPELVYLTGMTDEERCDRRLMQALANFTKLEPAHRIHENNNLLSRKLINENEIFTIESRETEMEGLILNPPTFVLKDNRVDYPNRGQFNLRAKIYSPCSLKDWIIVFSHRTVQDEEEVDSLVRNLREAGRTFGITVENPGLYYADGSLMSFLSKIEVDCQNHSKPQVVVTFLNSNHESKYYADLKTLLYLRLGIPHQNILRRSLHKNTISVASNILLQINAKLGEPLWKICRSLKEVSERKIAIGGIAIYHKLINKKDSCAAFVGTVDDDLTRYYCFAKLMEQNAQRIEPLFAIMVKWIQAYFKRNKALPDTLIIYRDGVGEGQIVSILDVELPALNKAIAYAAAKVRANYNPEVIFLLANKKVPQRMFEYSQHYERGRGGKGASNIMNPPPGSVISGPMSRYNYDFFMVPQWVNQGTATPTHYVVVHDSSKLSEQALITLTYEQCYNYYNWKGAIRIPASLMYANKLATMVGEHLKATPSDDSLSSKLYSL